MGMEDGFLKTFLIQFLAETYDRNFKMIIFLSSWGPLYGMRYDTRCTQALLVITGVTVAFIIRVTVFTLADQGSSFRDWWQTVAEICSPVALWLLTFKAARDYNSADQNRVVLDQAGDAEKATARVAAPAAPATDDGGVDSDWLQASSATKVSCVKRASAEEEESPAVASAASDANLRPPTPPEGLEAESTFMDKFSEPQIMAFVMPLLCTLAVSVSDPTRGAEYNGDSWATTELLAAFLGAIVAASLAVAAGTGLEHALSDRRFLLCAAASLGLTAVQATSAAVLTLGFPTVEDATPAPTPAPTPAGLVFW